MTKKRPFIIFIIGSLSIFLGVYTFLYYAITPYHNFYDHWYYVILIVSVGIGLILLKEWARKCALIVLIFYFLSMFRKGDYYAIYNWEVLFIRIELLLHKLVSVLFFYYLMTPKVKDEFKRKKDL